MILLLLLPAARAATLRAGPTDPYTTLTAAIAAASDGDTIVVAPGTWAEAIDLSGKDLTLRSSGGSAVTFLAPASNVDAVTLDSGERATLTGFTISPVGGRGVVVAGGTLAASDLVVTDAGTVGSRGGGLSIDGATVTLASSSFSGSTGTYGGHLYATGAAALDATDIVLTGGTATRGGAVYADDGATLTFARVLATSPTASRDGGFAWLDAASLSATDLTIDTPEATGGEGGAFYLTGHAVLDLDGGAITDAAAQAADAAGGAIHAEDGSVVTLTDLVIAGATATYGGALDLDNGTATLFDVRISDALADSGGAARVHAGATLSCEQCSFSTSEATGDGGAVLLGTGSTWADLDGTYEADHAGGSGGAFALQGTAAATFANTAFSADEAGDAGGAIDATGSAGIIATDTTFSYAVAARGDGGAIATAGALDLSDGAFAANTATFGRGGAIAATGDVTVDGTRFTTNAADDDGGALYAGGAAAVALREVTFFRNTAGARGGGVCVADARSVTIARGYLHGNTADEGGAIALDTPTTSASLSNLRVTDNVATDGGGLWLDGTVQIAVTSSTFAGNDASDRGGHLYTTGPVSLVDDLFYEAIDGGAAWGASDTGSDRYYNLAWDNAGGDWLGWSDVTGTSGNLAADPRLAAYTADGDETDDDLSLGVGSPAIDAGSPSLTDVDGSRSDIGAFGGPDADVQDSDGDGYFDNVDCDDGDAAVHPGAGEIAYDAIDQDCDGVDEDDLDDDGFAARPAGGDDCDDVDPTVFPDAIEIWYDGVDQDCSGGSDWDRDGDFHDAVPGGGDDCDDSDPGIYGTSSEIWYDGVDEDCDQRSDYDRDRDGHDATAYGGDDCDDFSAARFPGNNELPYDAVDQDCSGADLVDVDGDGWVAREAGGTDCNDANANVYPGAAEDPDDGFDDDCDGFYEWDRDGDGYQALSVGGDDCEDNDADIHPDALETWYDGVDQDCDGRDDDQDLDGYALADDCDDTDASVHPGAQEVLDGRDDDCDGLGDNGDRDGDGLSDFEESILGTDPADPDTDGDSLTDGFEFDAGPDRDDDGLMDALDPDDDDDGIATGVELGTDLDGDGTPDVDVDGDQLVNAWDLDSDADGLADADEGVTDADRDGKPDYLDYTGLLDGGGCGGGRWAGLIVLGAFLRRGKRDGAAPRPGRRIGSRGILGPVGGLVGGLVAGLVGGLLGTPAASAFDAHAFHLGTATGEPGAWTRLGAATLAPAGSWDAGLVLDYADAPLAEKLPAGRTPIVDALGAATLVGSYSLRRVQLNAQMPVVLLGSDDTGPFAATGDARIGAVVPLFGASGLRPAVAVDTGFWVPTGTTAHWTGGGARGMVAATASAEIGHLGLVAMAGAVAGVPDELRNLQSGIGPVAGAGLAWRISDATSTTFEVSTASDLGFAAPPVEATLSQRVRLPMGGWAVVGAATGLTDGVGASRWRAFAGVGFSHRPAAPSYRISVEVDPNADRDGDAIPDVTDRCPDQPETYDGFTDEDGCPELDGDADGVPFEKDLCPREPIRPEQDPRYSDGCPKVAEFAGNRIAITETIFFREDRADVLPSSVHVLEAVRDVIVAHPEIGYFLVEGHTNSNGADTYNLRLSDARAFAVMSWLGEHGVPSSRLLSKGFGETRPLADAADPDALAINRRVEFRVVRVEDIPPDARRIVLPADVRR
jgi:predicted outer membrane repeat protein